MVEISKLLLSRNYLATKKKKTIPIPNVCTYMLIVALIYTLLRFKIGATRNNVRFMAIWEYIYSSSIRPLFPCISSLAPLNFTMLLVHQ